MKSAGAASDVPPFAWSANSTWSFLKSVGFSQASTPFANFTMVTPTSSIFRVDGDRRRLRLAFRCSSRVDVVSVHGVTAVASAAASAACSSVVGRDRDVRLLRRSGEDDAAVVGEQRLAERGHFRAP